MFSNVSLKCLTYPCTGRFSCCMDVNLPKNNVIGDIYQKMKHQLHNLKLYFG